VVLAEAIDFWDHQAMAETRKPGEESAHDVLAAEEFAMPAPDPRLHRGPITLPEDPTGIAEPHDVLAAEEFAMPAGHGGSASGALPRARPSRRTLMLAAVGLLLLVILLLRRPR
jgi:hypothetical protein